MKDNEQLRECINSGQVSAAQVVAHAEAGELPPLPRPAVHAFADISESFLRADHYTAAQMRAYATAALAAERAEVARLTKALQRIANLDPVMDSEEGFNEWGEADCFNQAQKIAKTALTAPGEKHE